MSGKTPASLSVQQEERHEPFPFLSGVLSARALLSTVRGGGARARQTHACLLIHLRLGRQTESAFSLKTKVFKETW